MDGSHLTASFGTLWAGHASTERGKSKPTLAKSKAASASDQTLEQRARERGPARRPPIYRMQMTNAGTARSGRASAQAQRAGVPGGWYRLMKTVDINARPRVNAALTPLRSAPHRGQGHGATAAAAGAGAASASTAAGASAARGSARCLAPFSCANAAASRD
jgi:hypothetical protein